jgi:hypothetical protein
VSADNVELVRALYEEIGRLMVAGTDTAVERRTLVGAEGFATFLEGGRDTWRGAVLEAHEVVDLGEQVLVLGRFKARGRARGEDRAAGGPVWTVRDGRVVRAQLFLDRDEALAATRRV